MGIDDSRLFAVDQQTLRVQLCIHPVRSYPTLDAPVAGVGRAIRTQSVPEFESFLPSNLLNELEVKFVIPNCVEKDDRFSILDRFRSTVFESSRIKILLRRGHKKRRTSRLSIQNNENDENDDATQRVK
ncbi:hypothetical protein DAPPUDRAFT_118561 [Daphnia pulex]|uniref:Uncharacterized protein n=1 Tax=Daphnia pulex TaxID=6669 RepID=E9HW01_DAPPU|nr:hypothetical protein DAPPUDRAFT_118561 [Daphnia pulex]|eukprot:EFX64083.1 hypothetical protein DAPPUDRAFT_118561 [Daphnia pulex]